MNKIAGCFGEEGSCWTTRGGYFRGEGRMSLGKKKKILLPFRGSKLRTNNFFRAFGQKQYYTNMGHKYVFACISRLDLEKMAATLLCIVLLFRYAAFAQNFNIKLNH